MKRRILTLAASMLLSLSAVILLMITLQYDNRVGFQTVFAAMLLDAPTVAEINPSSGPNDLDTSIVITGSGFVSASVVFLGDTELQDVIYKDSTLLECTVPWGMEPGVYSLTVENPGGQIGSMADAYTVIQGLGEWTTGGPYGGKIIGLAVHPLTPTIVFAYAHDAGLLQFQ